MGRADEMQSEYGYPFLAYNTTTDPGAIAWFSDLVQLFQAMSVVVDNTPQSVGGAGTRLARLAPSLHYKTNAALSQIR